MRRWNVNKWRCFRYSKMPSSRDLNEKVGETRRLVRYAIFAWGSPAVIVILTWFPYFGNEGFRKFRIHLFKSRFPITPYRITGYSRYINDVLIWAVLLPMCAVVAISNTCFYVLTAFTIRKRKKETAHMIDGVSRHQKANEQWCVATVKAKTCIERVDPSVCSWKYQSSKSADKFLEKNPEHTHWTRNEMLFLRLFQVQLVRQAVRYNGSAHYILRGELLFRGIVVVQAFLRNDRNAE